VKMEGECEKGGMGVRMGREDSSEGEIVEIE
jgi:hypothetical protein